MKDRLPALDGLRGFAALSVALGHAGIVNFGNNAIPFVPTLLTFFSSAHNAVQILFVLSGFLMAYLYPSISSASKFITKRYARIFPVYGTIVIFLWLNTSVIRPTSWYMQLGILLFFALAVRIAWSALQKYSHLRQIGSVVFYLFVLLQTVVLLFNSFIAPQFLAGGVLSLAEPQKSILSMLTNLTLTTQLTEGISSMSLVFWSLGPELLFYILYPFIVITLVQIAKRGGVVISIFIILVVTKILLDLDSALMSISGLNGMNIARANGFVAGVTIGTLYQTKGAIWQYLQKIVGHPLFGLVALCLLIAVQLGESIVGLGSIGFMNIFYLITSWLIALVVLNAIIPGTLIYRIFSIKILTFLGLISYSLYLIHLEVLPWSESITKILFPVATSDLVRETFKISIFLFLSIGLSLFLFKTIEYLYFANKKKDTKIKNTVIKDEILIVQKAHSPIYYCALVLILILAFTFIYSGMYSPTLLVERHAFPNAGLLHPQEISLLHKNTEIPFKSQENNLSVVGMDLRYERSAGLTIASNEKPATLKFELLDDNRKLLFSSVRSAYVVEGSPRFQFGFPVIANSESKSYIVRLSLLNGKADDVVFVDVSPNSFISISTISRGELLDNPSVFLVNRFKFIVGNVNYILVILFVLTLVLYCVFNSFFLRNRRLPTKDKSKS